jgi:hypothetical protein
MRGEMLVIVGERGGERKKEKKGKEKVSRYKFRIKS